MAILSQYDLIVIDEVSMLTREQFERLLEMWKAAGTCDDSSAWSAHVREIVLGAGPM